MLMRSLVALVLGAAVAAGAAYRFYPLELEGVLRRVALYRGGARSVAAGRLNAYEIGHCAPDKPCRCMALIHGLGDSAMTWDKMLLAAPPEGWRLVALQLPGTAGTPEPSNGYAIPNLADDVRASLEPICPAWTIVGNSLGGWVAGWLALRWPEGVNELVLIDPAGLTDPSGRSEETARILADPTVEKMKAFAGRAYHQVREAPESAWPELVAAIKRSPAAKMVAAMSLEQTLDRRAADIKAPTTILWGQSDRVIPREIGLRFARLIPRARLIPLPACGHLPQRECPEAVAAFLFRARGDSESR